MDLHSDNQRPFDPNRIEVRTVHTDPLCTDGNTCDRLTDIGHPDHLYFIATPEDDPAIIAAHARHIGSGEQLMRWKRTTGLPEVPST